MHVSPLIEEPWWDLKPTFAGRVIDIVTAKTDTEESREAALKAVNETILLIVGVILTGYVCRERNLYSLRVHKAISIFFFSLPYLISPVHLHNA